MISITLPWPSSKLLPNARPHWRAKAAAVKLARSQAFWTAKEAKLPQISPGLLKMTMSLVPPDSRRRDIDGAFSACKALIDGICDAIGVDDRAFSIVDMRRLPPEKPGKVIIQIEEIAA